MVGVRAGTHERQRSGDAIDEGHARPKGSRNQPGQTESAAELDRTARAGLHRLRENDRTGPEMRPVRRLGRIERTEERRAIDVLLQIRDAPQRDLPIPHPNVAK
jgi:hypothetical protein